MNGSSKMRWKRFGQWFAFHLFGISLAIFLVINSTILYRWTLSWNGVLSAVHLSEAQLMKNYHQLISYLSFPWITKLKMTNFTSSAAGLQHFSDVKKLFMLNDVVLLVSGILVFFFVRELVRTKTLWRVIRQMQVSLLVPVFVAVMMSISFDQFFIGFHEVLFRNDDWMFDPQKDPIITALPETFFLECFVLFFVLIEIYYLIFLWLGKKQLKNAH